jgi:peptide/nickel transport system substrate-binding protein
VRSPRLARATAALSGAAALLLVAGCSAPAPTETGSADGPAGTFRFGINFDAANWNPLLAANLTYVQLPYEGLLSLASDGVTLEPRLATEWTVEPDKITLELRDDVSFHDGTPFDADAVITNIEHIQDSGTEWAGALSAIGEMTAVDDYTVELELVAPNPSLLFNLASRGNAMISPAALADGSWEQTPVGTGPYVLNEEETVQSSVYVFDYFDGYYAEDEIGPERVEIHYIPDGAARYNAVLTGEVDAARIDPAVADEAVASGLGEETWTTLRYHTFFFDRAEGGIFADPLVRQAMCAAYPYEDINAAAYEGTLTFPTQRIIEGDPAYLPDLEAPAYDIEAAQELMAEAGNPSIAFTLPYPEGQDAMYTLIQESYGQIGIDVTLQSMSSPQYFSTYLTGEYPLVFNTSTSEDGGMYNYYKIRFAEDGGLNPTHVAPPAELSSLFESALASSDPDEQASIFQEMNQYIADQALDCSFMDISQTIAYDDDLIASLPVTVYSPSAAVYKSIVFAD